MPVETERDRLAALYGKLRERLLDLTKKNRMLAFPIAARSKRQLQIVDEVLEEVYARLVGNGEATLTVEPLEEPPGTPEDERNEEFLAALAHARVADVEYLTQLAALADAGRDDDVAIERLDRTLRDRVRTALGMPPRRSRAEINRNDHARSVGIDPSIDLAPSSSKASHGDRRLQTLKYPDELEAVMEKIASEARLAEQEAGLSTLFLTFGFLEWYESEDSEKAYFAPLLLLPVRVTRPERRRGKGRRVFGIAAAEGEAETNVSLRRFLEVNFGRTLPDFDAGESDEPASVEAYFAAVTAAVDGLKRWRVRRQLLLGHFAFSRIAIYEDTDPARWSGEPVDHTLVGALLAGFDAEPAEGAAYRPQEDYPIDDPEVEKIAPILIHDADSSQHSALIDVMAGRNIVIEGPPGTGKSQTITNAIANLLAAGRSVLFLAEKQAALDAVKRRLDIAGLGDFCLELHSDKASPRAFVKSLADRHALAAEDEPAATSDPTWRAVRSEIRAYVDALHERQGDGATPFRLMWEAIRGRSVFTDAREVLRSKVGAADGDPLRLPALRGEVEVYGAAARHFADRHGHPARSPWQRTPPADLLGDERETLMAALRTLRDRQAALDEAVAGLREIGADDAAAAVAADRSLGLAPDAAAVAAILPHDLDGLDGALALRRRALEAADSLAALGADHLADIVIERAAALNVLWRGAYASRTPAEIYAAVERRIALVRDFAAVAGELAPAAAALGLPDSTPAGHLEAVAEAVLFAAQLPPDLAGWIAVAVGGDDFARLQATARDLRREEAELRRLLPQQTQPDWPDPDLLASAVAESQRGGLAKLFGRRALREALTRLGLADGPTGYERLARVADHQRRLTAFAADRAGPAVFADAWNGLSSPFPTLGAAIAAREDAERLLRALPGGATVAAALFRLGPDGLGRLATHAGAAARYRDGRPAFGALFDSTPLHGLRAACDGEVAALGEITAKDPDRVLVTVDLPIGRLAAIGDARRAAKAAREAFDAAALAPAARSLAGDLTGVQRIVDAVVFVRTVRSAGLPEPLSAALLATPAITREALREAAATWGDAETRHAEALDDVAAAGLPDIAFVPDGERRAHVDSLLEQAPALADFVALRRLRGGLDGAGLGELLAGADRAEIAPDRLPALFDAAIAGRRAEAARRSSEPLARRTGIDLDAKRQTFVERDRRKKEADRAAVRATLLRRTPPAGERSGSVRTWTEMALLWHEFQKQKQLAPVRDLLRRAPASVRALKPCFMMSPLSLAKFLPPGSFSFDVLVIDEASQMRPEDALGAMLRARQIVVVGDPKQLPPTSFFERSAEGGSDDGEADEVDDESILERCEKVFGRLRRLKWHYRSRCESLIRFSNEQFYDGSLVTFPAARPGSFSVDLVRADGAFAARRNVVEAERLTEEAIAFMHHFAAADEPPSLGIVALNIEQRDLIEETLWRLSAGDPLVEAFQEKTGRRGEGVFVKNLENVQGDERDFVFISMTYGMAEDSTVLAQRFGPINSANGHRRLNVLFSRARLRIVLFASFGSTDIRPGTATHRGVRVLKEYLQYAETGGRAAATATGRDPDSDFEIEVAERLRKRGYDVDLQVGVSGFRIDLGVRHPDRPDTFLAGIECDGARYHASRNARDRDRLREEVLRGLGWTILRVWSTDWFDDPDTQADRLVAKLDELRRGTRPSGWLDYRIAGRAEPGAAAPSGDGAREGDTPAGGDQRDTPGGDGRRDTPAEAATAPSGLSPGEEGEKAGLVEVPPLPLFPDDVRPPDAGDAGGGDGSAADTRRPPDAPAPDIASDDAAAQAAGSTTLTNASPDAGPLTETEVWAVLAELRETVIRPASPQFEPHRSILRDAMIESLIRQRLTDPDDWFTKIPAFLRSGTNPIEKRLYLERICELVARVT